MLGIILHLPELSTWMDWLSLATVNDIVAVALIVTLLVLAMLFVSFFLADKLRRKSRPKKGNGS
jgi:hypothetical protein